jgi:hypothetical protein
MPRYLRAALLFAAIALLATGAVACKSSKKTEPAKTSTPAATAERDTPERTAPSGTGDSALDSFHYTVDLDFHVNDPAEPDSSLVNGQVEGDFVAPDSHAFTTTFEFFGLSFSEEAVIIDDDAWYRETGSDWRPTTRDDPDVQNALSLTSADPGFLQDSEFESNLSSLNSEDDTVNGVEARRYTITREQVEALSQLLGEDFLQDAAGIQDLEMTVWLEKESGALVRAELSATASPEALGGDAPFELSEGATVSIEMTINLTRINDEDISIEPPL